MKRSCPPSRRSVRFQGVMEELESRLLFSADAAALLPTDPANASASGESTPQIQVMPAGPSTQSAPVTSGSQDEAQATTQVVGEAQLVARIDVGREMFDGYPQAPQARKVITKLIVAFRKRH